VTPHFVAKFNASFYSFGVWNNTSVLPGLSAAKGGENVGGYIKFDDAVVEMYIGVSWISLAQAQLNIRPISFDVAKLEAETAWESVLQRFAVNSVQSESKTELTKFYTAVYHSMCAPTTISEFGGTYLGFDNLIHEIQPPMKSYYSDMSMWDVYRTQMPLLSVVYGETIMADVVQSILLIAQQGQSLPQVFFD
jgi:putative alpha-1,2-mannosidase